MASTQKVKLNFHGSGHDPGHTSLSLERHLLGLVLLHSCPYGRSALDRSAHPWLLSAQYTVRLQSAVSR